MSRPSSPWYRTQSGSWVTKIHGHQYTLAKGPRERTRKAAHAEFARLQARHGQVETTPGDLAIWALRDHFLDAIEPEVGPDMFESYCQWTGRFVKFIGRSKLCASIIPHDVTQWYSQPTPRGKPWSRSTRGMAAKRLKRMFRWGCDQGLLSVNPLARLRVGGDGQRQCVLTPEECRRALDTAKGPLREYLAFLRETGCRPSEGMRVLATHVQAAQGIASMPGKTTGATGRQRVIYLTSKALEILRPLMDKYPEGPLFRNRNGHPWHRKAVALRMKRLRSLTGIPHLTAESFRHTYATEAAFRLLPAELAELMGNSVKTIAKYYLHVGTKTAELRAAAERARG